MKVLFLCGGRWQLHWLELFYTFDCDIFLVDPNDDCACLKTGVRHIKLDVKRTEDIVAALLAEDWSPDIVASDQTDVSVYPCAVLRGHYGLPGVSVAEIRFFVDKLKARELWNQISKSPVEFSEIRSALSLTEWIVKRFDKEWVVKPKDAQSSRGVHVVSCNMDQIDIDEAFTGAHEASISGDVLVEELLHGTEITVEGVTIDGVHRTLAVSKKRHSSFGVADELVFCVVETLPEPMKLFVERHDLFMGETGLRTGLTHVEYICDWSSGEAQLVEMACRGGGSFIPSLVVRELLGFDFYYLWWTYLFKGSTFLLESLRSPCREFPVVVMKFLNFGEGRVARIEGVEEINSLPFVLDLVLNFSLGEYLGPVEDDSQRHCLVFLKLETADDLEKKWREVTSILKVSNE